MAGGRQGWATTSSVQSKKLHIAGNAVGNEGVEEKRRDAYLLELLDGTLVNTTALVDQVTSL